jgi:S-(hydroxymethyl)glutathione dehydrogenase / alcohol dehydrogenase
MVYRGPYRIRVEEKDRPAIEHPNDAIVRVTRSSSGCRSPNKGLT